MGEISALARQEYLPKLFEIHLSPEESHLIGEAEIELGGRARFTPEKCYGHFPHTTDMFGIATDLPASKQLVDARPDLMVNGKLLPFNFLRLSLIKQLAQAPFHLDSDAETGLTGEVETVLDRTVWRALLNLSRTHPRKLTYLNVDPITLPLEKVGGYVQCSKKEVNQRAIRSLSIPHRRGTQTFGAILCVSQVLHRGVDDEWGHFIASYGAEEPREK